MTITTATATHIGDRTHNCDAAVAAVSPATTAVALIDGIGSSDEIAYTAQLLAEVAARVGVRKGPLLGLLAAGELIDGPGPESPKPNAVGAVAVVYPGDMATVIAHVGDVRVYSWTDGVLTSHTTDHTVGELLRQVGVEEQQSVLHDNWVRTTLGRLTVGSIPLVDVQAKVVVMTSDGVHKVLTDDQIASVVAEHEHDPQELADALVEAALAVVPEDIGTRDNTTVAVLRVTNEIEDVVQELNDAVGFELVQITKDEA